MSDYTDRCPVCDSRFVKLSVRGNDLAPLTQVKPLPYSELRPWVDCAEGHRFRVAASRVAGGIRFRLGERMASVRPKDRVAS